VGELVQVFQRYPHLGALLPAMGYGEQQVRDMEATLQRAASGGVEAIAVGTPIDLAAIMEIPLPYTRVRYELDAASVARLEEALRSLVAAARERSASV
jgi:predicted GTPase